MKYEIQVDVAIRGENSGNYPLRLQETSSVELTSLADAAMVLVKLHDFFEALKRART